MALMAAAYPAGPPPMTQTSNFFIWLGDCFPKDKDLNDLMNPKKYGVGIKTKRVKNRDRFSPFQYCNCRSNCNISNYCLDPLPMRLRKVAFSLVFFYSHSNFVDPSQT